MQPTHVAPYLYLETLIPAASAVAGLSPTALRFSPGLVLFRKYELHSASTTAIYANMP